MQKHQSMVEAAYAAIYPWRRRCATFALCLMATWVAYHVVFGANGMLVYTQKRSEHHALDKEIQGLKQENDRLARHVEGLKNDPKTIEKEAREQLRYARPGEVIYTLPQPRGAPSTVTAERR